MSKFGQHQKGLWDGVVGLGSLLQRLRLSHPTQRRGSSPKSKIQNPKSKILTAYSLLPTAYCLLPLTYGLLSTAAYAQGPEMGGVVYAGIQRGTTGAILVDGQNLHKTTAFVSGKGIKVLGVEPNAKGDYAEIKLQVEPEAALGPRELRLGNAQGISQPGLFWIDIFRQARETDLKEDAQKARAVEKTPVTLAGRLALNTERDVYAFTAQKGEIWVFDCVAARIRTRIDPLLELRDSTGHTLKMTQSAWETDPRMIYRFEKNGKYTLTVRDTQYRAGVDYGYLLTMGAIPMAIRLTPLGGRAGRTIEATLAGVEAGWIRSAFATLPPDAEVGPVWLTADSLNGPVLPFAAWVETLPATPAPEGTSLAELPSLPCCIDGVFARDPIIQFRFRAKPSERLLFDLYGRRIGSGIDGLLRVLDATGQEIAANDDAIGKDARLEFAPPKEGDYILQVRNLDGRTGFEYFYRLVARPVTPDFRLHLDVERLHVGAGGTVALPITVERLFGFNEAVTLQVEGLPLGVTWSGGTIPPNQNRIEVTFTATSNTSLVPAFLRLRGEALLANKKAMRPVIPRDQYLPRSIDPGMFTDDSYRRPFREWTLFPLGVIARKEPFALETSLNAITLKPGQQTEFTVRAVRQAGANGEIKLEARGMPEKVTLLLSPIPANQNEVRVTIKAAPDAPLALRNLILQGKLEAALQPAPAIVLQVESGANSP